VFESVPEKYRETAALIALIRRGDRPWHHFSDLVEEAGSALAVVSGDFAGDAETPTLFPREQTPVDLRAIAEEVEAWEAEGIAVVTVLDERYPANLRTIHNRPPLLFVCGQLTPADDRSVAVVGTRRASDDGLQHARTVASGLSEAGYTVISGLAAGIDTAAHTAALDNRRRTVAVIGTGIRRTYPAINAALQARIATEAAVLSQFWPDAPPTKTSFPMRNIVMSGLSRATVVIEAADRSGARIQARYALEHGRPVFLLESLLRHGWAREYADRPGAHVVKHVDEVVELVERLAAPDVLTV
jgi:DNA processing protein